MIALVFRRNHWFLTLIVIVTLGIVVSCGGQTQQTLVDYAASCAAEMGRVPAFSCFDGALIPITVNGVPQTTPVSTCDKPVQLGLGAEGQCVPFSRLVELSTGAPNVTTIAICRKYKKSSGQSDPNFQDIALIQHNHQTGNTCWFQSPPGTDRDGRSVPSPMDGSRFWYPPEQTGSINCQGCHDADAFIWTPYVAQVANVGNWNPNGPYVSNFLSIFPRQQPATFRPPNNACTACHRFGESTCGTRGTGLDLLHRAEEGLWMPPNHSHSTTQWHQIYDTHVDQLERCCANPSLPECKGATAQLTVNKVLIPSSAPGAFNLQIDGVTFATNVRDGGSTGPQVIGIGVHTVGETTRLSNDDFTAVIGGDCAPDGSITLAANDNKTCTITNTLTPIGVCRLDCKASLAACQAAVDEGGSGAPTDADCMEEHSVCQRICSSSPPAYAQLTVTKSLIPAGDSGRFNLQVNGETLTSNVGNGGSTGPKALLPGTHTVGETAGSGTSLASYTTVIGGDCAPNGSITLAPGDNKTCTIINTALPPAYLTVIKVVRPLGDPGLFDLQIDGVTVLASAGDGASTGPVRVSPDTHTVGEAGTFLTSYTSVISGDCAPNGSITLAPGDNKTCIITNTLNVRAACLAECQADLDACLAAVGEPGEPTAAVCQQQYRQCTGRCPSP
jgi:hypothetical protein